MQGPEVAASDPHVELRIDVGHDCVTRSLFDFCWRGKIREALREIDSVVQQCLPRHFAVAIRYVPGETRAPVILAMGKGPMALEIMERGRKVGLAPVQIPLLARALYFTGDIGAEINEQLYAAVAAVLAHVYRLDRGEGSVTPDIDLPPELRFSEFGQREARGDA